MDYSESTKENSKNETSWSILQLSEEQILLLDNKLDNDAANLFDEILRAYQYGSYSLCIMGLRAIIDHTITNLCVSKSIDLFWVDKNNKRHRKSLEEKFQNIKKFFTDRRTNGHVENIILYGNMSLHELSEKMVQKAVDSLIWQFTESLKEKAFSNVIEKCTEKLQLEKT